MKYKIWYILNLILTLNLNINADTKKDYNWQNKFKEKINNNYAPEWILNQINNDLIIYKQTGINKSQLDEIMKDNHKWRNALNVRIKIINNKIITENNVHLWPNLSSDYNYRSNNVFKILKDLISVVELPNLEFIINLHDDISFHNYKGPVFGFSKDKNEKNLILFPTLHTNLLNQTLNGNIKYPWNKKENKAFWRGTTTGGEYNLNNYYTYPRTKCVELSLKFPELIDAKFTSTVQSTTQVTNLFRELGYLGNHCSIEQHIKYKYQILIDGNTTAWERAYWQLFSNSVIFKQNSNKIQWYYGGIKPWIHYIPIENDISDLPEKIKWALNNDEKAYEISQNARKFAHENLNYEDILYYIYLLLTEYAKLQKFIVD